MVDDRHPAPMAMVCAADYAIALEDAPALLTAAEDFWARDEVMAVRKTKSGEREINIRPLALALVPVEGGFRARLRLTERDTLKPDLLIAKLAEMAGIEPPAARIHRLCLLGEAEGGALRPLMEL